MTFLHAYASPLGAITLASDGDSLTGLWFDGQKYDRSSLKNEQTEYRDLNVFDRAAEWLDIYFSGQKPDFTPPLRLTGSPFRRLVGEIMLGIPYGETVTYGWIARETAKRMGREHMSAQAVGGAVGHNPISLIVPCHRVLGADGSLTGYAGGIERKRWLLLLESTGR